MEKKFKFKVGDGVRCIVSDDEMVSFGDIGKITELSDCPYVNWDKGVKLAMCYYELELFSCGLKSTIGKALKKHGTTKAYRNEVMAHLDDATFYQDEKLTFLKTDKGTGYALRNPEDTNDAEKGIYLAVTRIFGETKPKWQVEVDKCIAKKEHFYINPTTVKQSIEAQKYLFGCGLNWLHGIKDDITELICTVGTAGDYKNIFIKVFNGKEIKM